MKHRASTGSRTGRTSRRALTALVCLALVVSGTGAVASGADPVNGDRDLATAVASTDEAGTVVETEPALEPAAEAGTGGGEELPAADATTSPAREQVAAPRAAAAPQAVAPLAVPSPTGASAVITTRVGGDRTGTSSVAGLAGVRLRLHDGGSSGPTTPVAASWATCVSDAQGDCSFVVPDTQQATYRNGECVSWFFVCVEYAQVLVSPAGVNRDRQFWVVEESVPAGWYSNPALVTGFANSQRATPYRFRTGTALRAGSTYTAGTHFVTDSGDTTATVSGARWQVSRDNPLLPQTCGAGIDVALVLDLSGSVADAGAVGDLKASAVAFAEALEGTGSRLSLFTFAQNAPRSSAASGRNYPDLLPIDGNLATIRSRIEAYSASGGTNWDRGIHQVAQNSQSFDLAIAITDGLATYSGSPVSGPGNYTRLVETEQAIFSANALKAKGTRVLAVGVGDGVSGEAHNLRAVSGPTGYTQGASANTADYFQTGWRQLAPLLENLAKGATCQATIAVDKVAQAYGAAAGPGAGWTFAATRTAGTGTVVPDGTQVTGAAGRVGYTVRFPSPTATTATVRLEERISSAQRGQGWSLTAISCTANGRPVTVTRSEDGVSLPVAVGDDVACTFTNTQSREPGVEIVKRAWAVPTAAQLGGAAELGAGAAVADGTTLTWTYTVRNTGQTALHDIRVTDDQHVTVTCPRQRLEVGEHMVCTGSGPVTARL